MIKTAWEGILARYAQTVSLHYGGEAAGIPARAFFQPVLERREDWRQAQPTPIGLIRRDRYLYLGDPEVPMDQFTQDGYVLWRGMKYEVQAAQPVYVGENISHWWAVLRPWGEEAE